MATHKKLIARYSLLSILSTLALLGAAVGTIFSALGLCSGSCSEAHKYRLFGFEFWQPGMLFIAVLAAAWICRSKNGRLSFTYNTILAIANGMELYFIYIQKDIIGVWCPVCLTIAASLAVLMLLRLYESIFPNKNPEGNKPMKNRCDKSLKEWFAWSFRKFTPPVFFFLGLCLAVAGVSKAEPPLPDVWTGNPKSATEIYFVSDWFCPYCKLVEPGLAKMVANLGRDNKITFVDLPIHQESFNYIPAHISLLLNYKSQYMAGRKVLSGLASLKITAPDESVIAAEMKKAGIVGYKTADFFSISRVAAAYGNFIKSSGASTTPSILVRNSKTGKKKLLPGAEAFKEIVIDQAIREVNS